MSDPTGSWQRRSHAQQRLIEQLVDELTPVRARPRVRVSLLQWFGLCVAGSALVSGAAFLMGSGFSFSLSAISLHAPLELGLALAAGGAAVAALAAAKPGRQVLLRDAGRVAWIGATLALGTLALEAWHQGGIGFRPLDAHQTCLARTFFVSALPVGWLFHQLGRGWVVRPGLAVVYACLAGGSVGALVSLAACPGEAVGHLVIGHAGPVALAVTLGAIACAIGSTVPPEAAAGS